MWLFSFLAQTHNSKHKIDRPFRVCEKPSDLIWNKYPGYCPACLDYEFTKMIGQSNASDVQKALEVARPRIETWISQEAEKANSPNPCQCLSRIAFAEERNDKLKVIKPMLDDFRLLYAEATRSNGKKKSGMMELQSMFEALFGNTYQVFSVQNIAFHLLEEVGEVSQALKDCYTFDKKRKPFSEEILKRRKMKFKEEIADVFSWLHALMLKIKHVYYRDAQEYFQSLLTDQDLVTVHFKKLVETISLSDIIWAKYGVTSNKGTKGDVLCCAGCFCAPCECKRDLKIDWTTKVTAIDKTD
jgi:NTP pyrophosphatase (non-canonical NTP hydrolase)